MKVSVLLEAIAIVVSLVLFFKGFLPIKLQITGHASERCCSQRHLSKVVLMVVDALKTEFVTKNTAEHWVYLNKVIEKGHAKVYNARVHPPTVTMPRIKALTSGDIPGFIDVLMNFDSTELKADNLLYQAVQSGITSVFYGDDTWLKLFPHMFTRSDGTTSFFVSDYTEVDVNVTRHLPSELARSDWDMMVLHYLGLDHIGHLIGPSSTLVPPKLQEMDSVVEYIHSQFIAQNLTDYLIILCGDHGMADQGGHGGVSLNEVYTPMVFISDSVLLSPEQVEYIYQIDMLPTLSALLNIPIAQNSRGVAISSLLQSLHQPADVLSSLFYNCKQLITLLDHDVSVKQSSQLHSKYEMLVQKYNLYSNSPHQPDRYDHLVKEFSQLMSEIQTIVASKVVDYDLPAMLSGLVLMFTVVIYHLRGTLQLSGVFVMLCAAVGTVVYTILYVHCTSLSGSSLLCTSYQGVTAATLLTLMTAALLLQALQITSLTIKNGVKAIKHTPYFPLYGFVVSHSVSLLASSFIEEEHQLAYFFSTTMVVGVLLYTLVHSTWNMSASTMLAAVCMVIARKWNQTGDKWSHLPDIADKLNDPEFQYVKMGISILSIPVIAGVSLYHKANRLTKLMSVVSVVCTVSYVMQDMGYPSLSQRGVYEADVVYFCCLTLLLAVVYVLGRRPYLEDLYTLRTSWVLLTMLLHRTVNLPLMALVITTEYLLSNIQFTDNFAVHLYYWLGQAAYFYQGNSNSLSTIDVGAGYKGMWSYSPSITPCLMLCNLYSGPIFWILSLCIRIHRRSSDTHRNSVADISWLFLTFKLLDMLILQILIILERYHLFVWTVFAPKLLYEMASLSLFTSFYILSSLSHRYL